MNEYHEQAEKFLNDNGIKFRATLSDSKSAPWIGTEPPKVDGEPHHYRVTLSRRKYGMPSATSLNTTPRIVFDFWGSIADANEGRTELHPYDVLACISGDVNTPETFKDFCGEYGYDTDSIKAKQMFTRCSNFAKRLRAFFTDAEREQLQEIQ